MCNFHTSKKKIKLKKQYTVSCKAIANYIYDDRAESSV